MPPGPRAQSQSNRTSKARPCATGDGPSIVGRLHSGNNYSRHNRRRHLLHDAAGAEKEKRGLSGNMSVFVRVCNLVVVNEN